LIDIEVSNFQSIEHCKLTVEGFTALVGRSNLGKSALIRAIKSALTGASGTGFVRHSDMCVRRSKKGKTCDCKTVVCIRSPDFDLKWEKGDKINRYTFNGQIYDRAEQGTPDFLLRPTMVKDFGRIEIGRKDRLLQVADQFDNVFLLDQSGNSVADVLSDVANLEQINVAIRAVEKDRKDAASTKRVLEKETQEQKEALEQYSGLDQLEQQNEDLIKKHLDLVKSKEEASKLVGYITEYEDLGTRIDHLEKACQVDLPQFTELQSDCTKVETLTRFASKVTERAQAVRALTGVENVSTPDSEALENKIQAFGKTARWVAGLRFFQTEFAWLKEAEKVVLPTSQPTAEALAPILALTRFAQRCQTLEKQLQVLEISHAEAIAEEAEVREEAATLGACPTCASPILGHEAHS
jgi:predicted ATP-dependent endonuclease of OLD family